MTSPAALPKRVGRTLRKPSCVAGRTVFRIAGPGDGVHRADQRKGRPDQPIHRRVSSMMMHGTGPAAVMRLHGFGNSGVECVADGA